MRNRVVTWHNTSLNPASRTLILINHRVRSLDTPEEGIPDHLSPPDCRLFPILFSIYVNKVDLREKIIKRSRVTWTFGKWPRYVQQGAVTADRNTRGPCVDRVEGKEKERKRERGLERAGWFHVNPVIAYVTKQTLPLMKLCACDAFRLMVSSKGTVSRFGGSFAVGFASSKRYTKFVRLFEKASIIIKFFKVGSRETSIDNIRWFW